MCHCAAAVDPPTWELCCLSSATIVKKSVMTDTATGNVWHQAAHITVLSETAAPLAKAELIRLHMCTTGLERGVFNRKRRVSIHPGCSLAWIKLNSFPQLLAHKGPWFTLSTFSSHPKLSATLESSTGTYFSTNPTRGPES